MADLKTKYLGLELKQKKGNLVLILTGSGLKEANI